MGTSTPCINSMWHELTVYCVQQLEEALHLDHHDQTVASLQPLHSRGRPTEPDNQCRFKQWYSPFIVNKDLKDHLAATYHHILAVEGVFLKVSALTLTALHVDLLEASPGRVKSRSQTWYAGLGTKVVCGLGTRPIVARAPASCDTLLQTLLRKGAALLEIIVRAYLFILAQRTIKLHVHRNRYSCFW